MRTTLTAGAHYTLQLKNNGNSNAEAANHVRKFLDCAERRWPSKAPSADFRTGRQFRRSLWVDDHAQ
jgi:hypothetical protein